MGRSRRDHRQRHSVLVKERKIRWSTGVEMEALTAVAVAGLTLYDMCKAVDPEMVLGEIRLIEKLKEELTESND